jgi:hypothetical protein
MNKCISLAIISICVINVRAMEKQEPNNLFLERLKNDIKSAQVTWNSSEVLGRKEASADVKKVFSEAGYTGQVYELKESDSELVPVGSVVERDRQNRPLFVATKQGIYVNSATVQIIAAHPKIARSAVWYVNNHIPLKRFVIPNLVYYGGMIGGLGSAGYVIGASLKKSASKGKIGLAACGSLLGLGFLNIGLSMKEGYLRSIWYSYQRNRAYTYRSK